MSTVSDAETPSAPTDAASSWRQFLLDFLRLGTLGFGGPIALAGYMQRDLVERRRWISKEDYVQGLALAQLAPGPLAAQLAMYLGWVRARLRGATYADVRVMQMRQRDLTTKNGQVGTLGQSESIGLGIRVVANGAWGFASSDQLTREGLASCAAQAVAEACARILAAKKSGVVL